ncbi:hypothetical protein TI39_contig4217g00002 [Zymoseptoria brevis]|uniref:Uncharacterized protein n=1 Tax=Zymoseptoria brevis TaxID=1047168 RepID=A0A0F4G9N4_9PEZI|nr:hypothetical protein TI39_contig4217g00002 [Zymoseptoria brevis]
MRFTPSITLALYAFSSIVLAHPTEPKDPITASDGGCFSFPRPRICDSPCPGYGYGECSITAGCQWVPGLFSGYCEPAPH